MHVSNTETEEEYTIEDLPKFFKDRSKKISKKLSDRVIEISTIRSESTKDGTQEISFKLRISKKESILRNIILSKIEYLISFFKNCLNQKDTVLSVNKKIIKIAYKLHKLCCEIKKCFQFMHSTQIIVSVYVDK